METVSLLDFLHNAKDLYALEYSGFSNNLVNILELINVDEQFTRKIDLGVIYYAPITLDQFTIIDGLNRIVSLSLLLHAVCECYKKTSERNDKAIRTIRSKYLLTNGRSKLRLAAADQDLYDKIINGERLSGREKESKMFMLLHRFWTQIKENELQAAYIFKMLQRIYVISAEIDNVPPRDLYYSLHKTSKDLNQIALITDYLKDIGIVNEWNTLVKSFNTVSDLKLFFRDFFITKFKLSHFDENKLYENFINYFETMMQYMPEDLIMKKMKHSAALYYNILNVKFRNENIKEAFINIKKAAGEDTYAYILEVYEDYVDNNISEATFIEILNTIAEYLHNRRDKENNISFNELIQYLNAFITCK